MNQMSHSMNEHFKQEVAILIAVLVVGILLLNVAHSYADSNYSETDTQYVNTLGWVEADSYSEWIFSVNNGQFDVGQTTYNYWTHANWGFSATVTSATDDPTQSSLTSTIWWTMCGGLFFCNSGSSYNNVATTPNSQSEGEFIIYTGTNGVVSYTNIEYLEIAFEIALAD